MITRRIFPFRLLGGTIFVKRGAADSPAGNDGSISGSEWNSLTSLAKAAYVTGFSEGVRTFSESMSNVQGASAQLKLTAVNTMLSSGALTHGDFMKVLDGLYQDPANSAISVRTMWTIASMRVRGESEDYIQKSLARLRKMFFNFFDRP